MRAWTGFEAWDRAIHSGSLNAAALITSAQSNGVLLSGTSIWVGLSEVIGAPEVQAAWCNLGFLGSSFLSGLARKK